MKIHNTNVHTFTKQHLQSKDMLDIYQHTYVLGLSLSPV